MADKKRSTFASSSTNDQFEENQRNNEQDNQTGRLSPQWAERNTGDDQALRPQTPMDVDVTNRSQTVQSQEESPCVPHTQIVTGTTMNTVGNTGPVQIGTGNINTVIKKQVYKNCNVQHHHHHHYHHHPASFNPDSYSNYLRMVEQAASSLEPSPLFPGQPSCPVSQSPIGNPLQDHTSRDEDTVNRDASCQSQTDRKTVHHSHHKTSRDNISNHVPCHCQDCLLYHHNAHRPLDEHHYHKNRDSKPRHQRLSHPPVPQLPSPQQIVNEESTKERARVNGGEKRENLTSDIKLLPRPDETSPVCSEGIPDSVCIIDSRGQSLEPGDAVWFERDGDRKWPFSMFWKNSTTDLGIYVVTGHQQEERPSGVKGELKLARPFGKLTVVSGEYPLYPRGEVISRAESRVGTVFTEGDSVCDGSDFPHWVMTGLGWSQARL